MTILIGIILALLSLAIIMAPFIRSRSGRRGPRPSYTSEEVQTRRENIYEEIRALQLDYQLGNIEEEEYQELMRARRLEAAALIRQQEEEEGRGRLERLDQELEQEIRAVRKKGGRGG